MTKLDWYELVALEKKGGYRALHDAGIAHGWRECIEALRGNWVDQSAAGYLERLLKERGHE